MRLALPSADNPYALRVGDVVQLASGGCAMTVAEISGAHSRVLWLDHAGHLQHHSLPLSALRVVER